MKNQALKEIVVRALVRVPIFAGLGKSALEGIASLARIIQFKKDIVIFKEGDVGDKVYIIVNGKVKIYITSPTGEETELKVAGSCDVFGEMALLDVLPRSADARALEDAVLFYIEQEHFMGFLMMNPEVTLKLLEMVSLKLRKTNEMVLELRKSSPIAEKKAKSLMEKLMQDEKAQAAVQPTASTTAEPGTGDQKEWIYTKQVICPLCLKEFSTTLARSKFVQVEKTDSDTCSYYATVNPNFYYIQVCKHCGFAFTEDYTDKFSQRSAKMITQQLPSMGKERDYSGKRTIDDAIETYFIAIECQTVAKSKSTLLGRLFMKLSCLYRTKGMPNEDIECLRKALENLEKSYSNEYSPDPRSELNLTYLIGEIYGRLGDVAQAIQWFNRVVSHPDKNLNPYIVSKARDRWQDLKSQMKN